jgi:hypothetical protein
MSKGGVRPVLTSWRFSFTCKLWIHAVVESSLRPVLTPRDATSRFLACGRRHDSRGERASLPSRAGLTEFPADAILWPVEFDFHCHLAVLHGQVAMYVQPRAGLESAGSFCMT